MSEEIRKMTQEEIDAFKKIDDNSIIISKSDFELIEKIIYNLKTHLITLAAFNQSHNSQIGINLMKNELKELQSILAQVENPDKSKGIEKCFNNRLDSEVFCNDPNCITHNK